jgi:release factor glutamine methyltransferase
LRRAAGNAVADTLASATLALQRYVDTPRLEAEVLLTHVLGCSRSDLYARPEKVLDPHRAGQFARLTERRSRGEPLPYLTGCAEFFGLDFIVNRDVLIPRPETETLVELTLSQLTRWSLRAGQGAGADRAVGRPVVVDVGTGCGCIAVAVAQRMPDLHIYALDISARALRVARANGRRHGVADRITFARSDLLAAAPKPVDLVVANLPYIAEAEWDTLPPEVRVHEPRLALAGGFDGLDVIRKLLNESRAALRVGGAILMECGVGQATAVTALARQVFPAATVSFHSDLSGRDRVLSVDTGLAAANVGA